jgi:hypothetical protein
MYTIEQYVNVLVFTGLFALGIILFELAFAYVYAWYDDKYHSQEG